MKKHSSFKKQNLIKNLQVLTPQEIAKEIVRPYILKGDTMAFLPNNRLSVETDDYSAYVEKGKVFVTMLYDVPVKEEFSLKNIMREIVKEIAGNIQPNGGMSAT